MKGRVACMESNRTCFKVYVRESYFGDIEILQRTPRIFSTMALSDCTLLSLNPKVFENIRRMFPELCAKLLQRSIRRYISAEIALTRFERYHGITQNDEFWTFEKGSEKQVHRMLDAWLEILFEGAQKHAVVDNLTFDFAQLIGQSMRKLFTLKRITSNTRLSRAKRLNPSLMNFKLRTITEVDSPTIEEFIDNDTVIDKIHYREGLLIRRIEEGERIVADLGKNLNKLTDAYREIKNKACKFEETIKKLVHCSNSFSKDDIISELSTLLSEQSINHGQSKLDKIDDSLQEEKLVDHIGIDSDENLSASGYGHSSPKSRVSIRNVESDGEIESPVQARSTSETAVNPVHQNEEQIEEQDGNENVRPRNEQRRKTLVRVFGNQGSGTSEFSPLVPERKKQKLISLIPTPVLSKQTRPGHQSHQAFVDVPVISPSKKEEEKAKNKLHRKWKDDADDPFIISPNLSNISPRDPSEPKDKLPQNERNIFALRALPEIERPSIRKLLVDIEESELSNVLMTGPEEGGKIEFRKSDQSSPPAEPSFFMKLSKKISKLVTPSKDHTNSKEVRKVKVNSYFRNKPGDSFPENL